MNKRNLVEDLTICEAATPGTWKYNGNEVVATEKPFVGIAGAMSEEDCEFIAAARDGWPEAIRIAIAAEEEVERMKEGITDAISIWEWMDMDDDLVDIAEKIVEKLRETFPSIQRIQEEGKQS